MPRISRLLRPEWSSVPQGEFRRRYSQLQSFQDLADFLGVRAAQVSYYAFQVDKIRAYSNFSIPRSNGQPRVIDVPVRTLKYIQRLIHESLVQIYRPHPAVHGFMCGRSVLTNASNHLNSRYVLNIDLQDFFPTITRQRIFGRLVKPPYSLQNRVANAIAALTTNHLGRLPQGSPASPVIANIVAASLDHEIARLCGPLGCRYTRYADDITISKSRGEMPPSVARYPTARGTGSVIIGDRLAKIIYDQGFRINERKSRLQSYGKRQTCTGLVINGDKPTPPKRYVRRLRSLVHHWRKNGWQDAAQILNLTEKQGHISNREQLSNKVAGRLSYIQMIKGQDDPITQKLQQIIASIPPDY